MENLNALIRRNTKTKDLTSVDSLTSSALSQITPTIDIDKHKSKRFQEMIAIVLKHFS